MFKRCFKPLLCYCLLIGAIPSALKIPEPIKAESSEPEKEERSIEVPVNYTIQSVPVKGKIAYDLTISKDSYPSMSVTYRKSGSGVLVYDIEVDVSEVLAGSLVTQRLQQRVKLNTDTGELTIGDSTTTLSKNSSMNIYPESTIPTGKYILGNYLDVYDPNAFQDINAESKTNTFKLPFTDPITGKQVNTQLSTHITTWQKIPESELPVLKRLQVVYYWKDIDRCNNADFTEGTCPAKGNHVFVQTRDVNYFALDVNSMNVNLENGTQTEYTLRYVTEWSNWSHADSAPVWSDTLPSTRPLYTQSRKYNTYTMKKREATLWRDYTWVVTPEKQFWRRWREGLLENCARYYTEGGTITQQVSLPFSGNQKDYRGNSYFYSTGDWYTESSVTSESDFCSVNPPTNHWCSEKTVNSAPTCYPGTNCDDLNHSCAEKSCSHEELEPEHKPYYTVERDSCNGRESCYACRKKSTYQGRVSDCGVSHYLGCNRCRTCSYTDTCYNSKGKPYPCTQYYDCNCTWDDHCTVVYNYCTYYRWDKDCGTKADSFCQWKKKAHQHGQRVTHPDGGSCGWKACTHSKKVYSSSCGIGWSRGNYGCRRHNGYKVCAHNQDLVQYYKIDPHWEGKHIKSENNQFNVPSNYVKLSEWATFGDKPWQGAGEYRAGTEPKDSYLWDYEIERVNPKTEYRWKTATKWETKRTLSDAEAQECINRWPSGSCTIISQRTLPKYVNTRVEKVLPSSKKLPAGENIKDSEVERRADLYAEGIYQQFVLSKTRYRNIANTTGLDPIVSSIQIKSDYDEAYQHYLYKRPEIIAQAEKEFKELPIWRIYMYIVGHTKYADTAEQIQSLSGTVTKNMIFDYTVEAGAIGCGPGLTPPPEGCPLGTQIQLTSLLLSNHIANNGMNTLIVTDEGNTAMNDKELLSALCKRPQDFYFVVRDYDDTDALINMMLSEIKYGEPTKTNTYVDTRYKIKDKSGKQLSVSMLFDQLMQIDTDKNGDEWKKIRKLERLNTFYRLYNGLDLPEAAFNEMNAIFENRFRNPKELLSYYQEMIDTGLTLDQINTQYDLSMTLDDFKAVINRYRSVHSDTDIRNRLAYIDYETDKLISIFGAGIKAQNDSIQPIIKKMCNR